MNTKTCFDILGIQRHASLDEAKQSYKRLVKRWHPDQYGKDPQKQRYAHEKLTEINVAYRDVVAILKTVPPDVAIEPEEEPPTFRQGADEPAPKKKDSIFKRMATVLKSRKTDMGGQPEQPQPAPHGRTEHGFDMGGHPSSEFQRVLKRVVRNQPRRTGPGKAQDARRQRTGRGTGRSITPGNYAPPRRGRGDRVEKIRPVRRVGKI
jgi:hypothetical protein